MTDRELRAYARQGGKRRALEETIAARLAEGWTEVTDDREFAPRVKGVRLFVRPGRDERPDPAAEYGGDLTAPLCCCKRGLMCGACGTGQHWQCPDRDDWDDEADGGEPEDWQDEDD